MYAGWLELAGNEVVNDARAWAAAMAHGLPVKCEPCDGMAAGLDEPPYTGNPQIDQAPWFDKTRPESARFLGVIGLSATGYSASPVSRTVTELIGDGASLGALRRAQRDMVYEVMLLALDDQAMSYGYEWLAAVLRGIDCAGTCGGADMCVMTSCPTTRPEGMLRLRHLYDVGLTDGLTESEHRYLSRGGMCDAAQGCCEGCDQDPAPQYAKATFTLSAGMPHIYREPLPVDDGRWTSIANGNVLTGYDPEQIAADCPQVASCASDPDCTLPPLPPSVAVPNNPCWPTGKATFRRTWITVHPTLMPQWAEMVPVIEVYSGEKDLRRLTIRFYPNPAGLDCSQAGADPCSACTSVNVAYLPSRSTFTLDGRTRFASVDCSTATRTGAASPQLYGPGGAAFAWPVFECPTGLCIEILAADNTVTPSTQVRMFMAHRSDAA
ncbi:hypothetical protein ACWD2L_00475 [Streptomyces sp. NPDC002754]